jgi:hypothetical protein
MGHKLSARGLQLILGALVVAGAWAQRSLVAPVDVGELYVPSGFMGDGEAGGKVQVRRVAGEKPRAGSADGLCVKVSYLPGSKGWAGVYWQHPADNWGDAPGLTIVGATRITFWAAGAKGGEIVEFKAGGINGKRYQDSFEVSSGSLALSSDWKQYRIDLRRAKLSNVVGGFAWDATAADNPNGLTFYLDRIRYE